MRLFGGTIFAVLQRIGYDWAKRCFPEQIENIPERALRAHEEQTELAQALGVPRELAHLNVDKVYDRPPGDPEQEMGGVLHTAAILCQAMNWDADELHEREVRRVLEKSTKHFADRNQKKLDAGLQIRSGESLPEPGSTVFELIMMPQTTGADIEYQFAVNGVKVDSAAFDRAAERDPQAYKQFVLANERRRAGVRT